MSDYSQDFIMKVSDLVILARTTDPVNQFARYPDMKDRYTFLPLTMDNIYIFDTTRPVEYDSDDKRKGILNPLPVDRWLVAMRAQGEPVPTLGSFMEQFEEGRTLIEILGNRDIRAGCKRVMCNGRMYSVSEISERTGLTRNAIYARIHRGISDEEITSAKVRDRGPVARTYECDGESHTIREWSEISGIPGTVIRQRINNGWSVADAVHVPVIRSHRGE